MFTARTALIGLTSIAALSGPVAGHAEAECQGPRSETSIEVTVSGLRDARGQVAVTLYADDSSRFLVKHGSMYSGRVAAAAPVTKMCLYVPRPGVYALAVYHDANANGKFDRGGLIGLPLEAYGFSNNPPTFVSLPSFRSVRLDIARSGMTTNIKLKYP
jgi:uncharacterized protein (DUF2141 family)